MQCTNYDSEGQAVKVPFVECTDGPGRAMMQFTNLQIDLNRYADFLSTLPNSSERFAKQAVMDQLQRHLYHDL